MIVIEYMKSKSGLDNCFELHFMQRDYIEEKFFRMQENGYAAELYYYIALFLKNGLFDGKSVHSHRMIWSCQYDCFYYEIPFRMNFDADYDAVSFSVDEDNILYRERIAEHIKTLVEQKTPLEMIDIEKCHADVLHQWR